MIASKEFSKLICIVCIAVVLGIWAAFNIIGFVAFLAYVAYLFFWSLRIKPDFFIFYGQNDREVALNRYIIDRLTARQVSKLSEYEIEFVEYCKNNPEFRMHITLQAGGVMTQKEICRMMLSTFITARGDLLASNLIDMAEVLATEPGPDSIG